jgi:hypothetical protein
MPKIAINPMEAGMLKYRPEILRAIIPPVRARGTFMRMTRTSLKE